MLKGYRRYWWIVFTLGLRGPRAACRRRLSNRAWPLLFRAGYFADFPELTVAIDSLHAGRSTCSPYSRPRPTQFALMTIVQHAESEQRPQTRRITANSLSDNRVHAIFYQAAPDDDQGRDFRKGYCPDYALDSPQRPTYRNCVEHSERSAKILCERISRMPDAIRQDSLLESVATTKSRMQTICSIHPAS